MVAIKKINKHMAVQAVSLVRDSQDGSGLSSFNVEDYSKLYYINNQMNLYHSVKLQFTPIVHRSYVLENKHSRKSCVHNIHASICNMHYFNIVIV